MSRNVLEPPLVVSVGRVPGRIAVLIPVFNDDGRLRATLASLADQGEECTAVVVDDGSSQPLEIDPRSTPVPVALIRLQTNAGIEGALNAGLDWIRRTGQFEYVARLDNGDRCLPRRLAVQASLLDRDPTLTLIGSGVVWETADGKPAFSVIPCSTPSELARELRRRCPLIHPTLFFRTSLVATVGGYRTDAPAAEDYDFIWRAAQVGAIGATPELLVFTRLDPRGISLSRRRRQLRSRMLVQFRYANWALPDTYIGLALTAALFLMPTKFLRAVKRALSHRSRSIANVAS